MKPIKEVIQEAVETNHTVHGQFHRDVKETGFNGPYTIAYKHHSMRGATMPSSVQYILHRDKQGSGAFDKAKEAILKHGFKESAGSPSSGHSEDVGNFVHHSYHHPDGRKVELQSSMDGTRVMYHNPENRQETRPVSGPAKGF
jgi:hypothetical protein